MVQSQRPKTSQSCSSMTVWVLLLSNLLVFQISFNYRGMNLATVTDEANINMLQQIPSDRSVNKYPLSIETSTAVALPSIRVSTTDDAEPSQQKASLNNPIYGGKGDKAHLGGWTDLDHHGVSPKAWKWMVTELGIHSVLDVGCGRGISTSWFHYHGLEVACVEGSHDAVENTVIPDTSIITEHDFSRGPWWPSKTYDAIWCVEFLEHVGRNFHKNYLPTFRKAAFVFVSHSLWGGHHHVEVHSSDWWKRKFTMYGFIFDEGLTNAVREKGKTERAQAMEATTLDNNLIAPNGIRLNAQHVWSSLMVFINPAVASLPEHAHLLSEPGCYVSGAGEKRINRECGTGASANAKTESLLPDEYKALVLTPEQDSEWFNRVKGFVTPRDADEEKDLLARMQGDKTPPTLPRKPPNYSIKTHKGGV